MEVRHVEKIRQRDGTIDTIIDEPDGGITIKSEANIDKVLAINAAQAAEAQRANLIIPDSSPLGFHAARIPQIVITMWADQGFHLLSSEKSGMTPEEHDAELMRRLSGDWAKLNVSKFKTL